MMQTISKVLSFSIAGILTATIALVAVSCGDDKKDDTTAAPTTSIKYTDVQPFIALHCANSGCHDSTTKAGSYDMSSRTNIAAKASNSLSRIKLGSMPEAGSPQKTSFDKETTGAANLSAWLDAGAPE